MAHRSPGRLRLRVEALRQTPDLGRRIVEALSDAPGVTRVEATATTGSVLVLHDGAGFDEAHFARLAQESELFALNGTSPAGPEPIADGLPPRGAAVYATWNRVNLRLHRASSGLFDLRTLVPLALCIWAIRQIVLERPLARTPWYTLLWYAFGLFTKFNDAPKKKDAPAPPNSGALHLDEGESDAGNSG